MTTRKHEALRATKGQYFCERSVAVNLVQNQFEYIDDSTRMNLIDLIARISEKSYRRGFQHGSMPGRKVDASYFRNTASLDRSPYTDTFTEKGRWASKSGFSLFDRLFMEYPELYQVGLGEPLDIDEHISSTVRWGK